MAAPLSGPMMRSSQSPHAVLGLAPGARPEEVRAAFRAVAKTSHPDVTGDPAARDRFVAAQAAYREITRGAASADAPTDALSATTGNPRMNRMTEIELPVTVWTAVRGGTVRGTCILGKASVRVAPGTRTGDRIVARIGSTDVAFVVRLSEADGFRAEGASDLSMPLRVPRTLARAGGAAEVETPGGRLRVRLPKGTEDGVRLKVEGHGLPPRGERPAGALYLDIQVIDTLTDRAVAALEGVLARAGRSRTADPAPGAGQRGTG
jgi:curved DNA-binding protein